MVVRRPTTNDNIRDLLDALRLELKADIQKVSDKVESVDKTVSNNALKQAVSSTKIGFLIAGITIIVSSITTIIIERIAAKI